MLDTSASRRVVRPYRAIDARSTRSSVVDRRTRVVTRAGPKNRLREKELRKASERDGLERSDGTKGSGAKSAPAGSDRAVEARSKRTPVRRFVRKVQRKAKKAAQRAVDALVPTSDPLARRSEVTSARVGVPTTTARYRSARRGADGEAGRATIAWGTLFALAWLALKVINRENPLRAIGGALRGMRKGGTNRPPPRDASGPGRWVIDRSLGGKTIWVPDANDRYRDERRRLEGALDDMPGGTQGDARARAKGPSAGKARVDSKPLPAWWVAPTPQYVPPGRKDELILTAKAEGSKLARNRVSGVGFSADAIVDFRNACAAAGERGCAVKSVGPESARVAVFRAAADIAVSDALRGQAGAMSSFGAPVGSFLVGLADDLELEAHKCVSIVMADVAVRVRGVVIQASAGLRSNDSVATILELDKLVNLFNAFPFAADAAELDMLAVGFRSRLSESERERIVAEYQAVSGGAHVDVVRAAVIGPASSVYE